MVIGAGAAGSSLTLSGVPAGWHAIGFVGQWGTSPTPTLIRDGTVVMSSVAVQRPGGSPYASMFWEASDLFAGSHSFVSTGDSSFGILTTSAAAFPGASIDWYSASASSYVVPCRASDTIIAYYQSNGSAMLDMTSADVSFTYHYRASNGNANNFLLASAVIPSDFAGSSITINMTGYGSPYLAALTAVVHSRFEFSALGGAASNFSIANVQLPMPAVPSLGKGATVLHSPYMRSRGTVKVGPVHSPITSIVDGSIVRVPYMPMLNEIGVSFSSPGVKILKPNMDPGSGSGGGGGGGGFDGTDGQGWPRGSKGPS